MDPAFYHALGQVGRSRSTEGQRVWMLLPHLAGASVASGAAAHPWHAAGHGVQAGVLPLVPLGPAYFCVLWSGLLLPALASQVAFLTDRQYQQDIALPPLRPARLLIANNCMLTVFPSINPPTRRWTSSPMGSTSRTASPWRTSSAAWRPSTLQWTPTSQVGSQAGAGIDVGGGDKEGDGQEEEAQGRRPCWQHHFNDVAAGLLC